MNSKVQSAYAECRRLAKEHYENFPVASWLAPRDKRDALAAIYAFARLADDTADEPSAASGQAGREARLNRLNEWRQKLLACYAGEAADPVFIALADAVRRFDLSRIHFENLLRAFESDVRVNRHPNFQSLLDYCSCSANPVGRLVLELFGHKNNREGELFSLSDNICTALQLTNFWQDVRIDLERDRVYLPQDDLRSFGLSLDDLREFARVNGRPTEDRWSRLMAFEIERTRNLFREGKALLDKVAPSLRRQLRLTWLGGMEILSRIDSVKYDVFRQRPSLGRLDFVRLYFLAGSRLDGSGGALAGPPPATEPVVPAGRTKPAPMPAAAISPLTNFYYSFLFLPKEKRRALEAVYAFARRGDDIVDEDVLPKEAERALAAYRRDLDACFAPAATGARRGHELSPRLDALAEAIRRYKIPRQPFDDLILGLEMDLSMDRGSVGYRTFDELFLYCYRVASTIGLISVEIFGYQNPETKEYAINLGVALQLVNILRDIQSDARRGRIYVPREDLEKFGVKPSDLGQGRYGPEFIELMRFECSRARNYFGLARNHLAPEDRRSMVAAEIMAAIYWKLLRRIERRNYNVFGERVRLSRPHKLRIALAVFLGANWRE